MAMKIDELYYDIAGRTEKLATSTHQAEQNLKKLAATITKHPIAALGVLGGAFVATAYLAAKAADQMDRSIRRAGSSLPEINKHVDGIRRTLVALTTETSLGEFFSAQDLATGLEAAAKAERELGSAMDLLERAATVNAAFGGDLNSIVGQIDQASDAFGRSARNVSDLVVVAQQGGLPIDEFSAILERSGARASAAGVSLEKMVSAAIAMREEGLSLREIGAVFNNAFGDVLEKTDKVDTASTRTAATLRVVGGELILTGQGADKLAEAQGRVEKATGAADRALQAVSGTIAGQEKLLRNRLSTAWQELGERLRPIGVWTIETLNKLLAGGRSGATATSSAARQILELGKSIDTLKGAELGKYNAAWHKFIEGVKGGAPLIGLTRAEIDAFAKSIQSLTDEELNRLLADAPYKQLKTPLSEASRRSLRAQRDAVLGQLATASALAGDGTESGRDDDPLRDLAAKMLAAKEISQQFRDVAASLTASLTDDLRNRIRDLAEALEKLEQTGAATPEQLAQGKSVIAQLRAELERLPELERIQRVMQTIGDSVKDTPAQALAQLNTLISETEKQLALTKEGTVEHERLNDLLREQRQLRKDITADVFDLGKNLESQEQRDRKRLDTLRDQAHAIESAARGALQLAEAFGIVDGNAAAALTSMVQIAANLPTALDSSLKMIDRLPGILSVAGGVASMLAGFFGQSPEDQARKELLRRNNEALEKLTATLGEFGKDITGRQFTNVGAALGVSIKDIHNQSGLGGIDAAMGILTGHLRNAGTSMAELRQVAEELGISIDTGSVRGLNDSLRQLQQAIAETELTRFASTFADQMTALRAEFELFDITDPIAQLEKMRELFGKEGFGSPALARALAGLDLSTAEGRRMAEEALQALLGQLQTGTLDPSDLGGLTAEELLQMLQQMESLIDQVGEAAGESKQFTIDRTITEVTANRIAAFLSTSNVYQQQIAENTEAIARLLATMAPAGALQPPTFAELERLAGSGSAGAPLIGSLTVMVQLPAGVADPRAIGDAIAQETVRAMDTALGEQMRRRARAHGNVLIS